jgi:hypothetical protein
VLGPTTFLLSGERLYALGQNGSLEPLATPGLPLAIAADPRGRLLVALGAGGGVVVERWAPERGGRRERLGTVAAAPADVRGVAALDGVTWLLAGTRRLSLSDDDAGPLPRSEAR